ncbi:MAG: mechanosensitive ion channel family protein [Castellaniella sp.]
MEELRTFWAGMPGAGAILVHLAVTLVILVVGWLASNWLGRWARLMAKRSSYVDPTIVPILVAVVVWAVRVVVLLAVLARLGVETTSLIAVLGASALAIGLALQGTLTNFAAGIMLLILRPIRTGEFVSIAGHGMGTVDEISIFMTRLEQLDGTFLLLPNTLVWGTAAITNYSRNPTRRIDLTLGVRYDDDLDLALATLKKLADEHEHVLDDPAPQVMVEKYGDSVIMINLRAWMRSAEYWDAYYDLYRRAPEALREAGMRPPIPQRQVLS